MVPELAVRYWLPDATFAAMTKGCFSRAGSTTVHAQSVVSVWLAGGTVAQRCASNLSPIMIAAGCCY